MIKLSFIIPCYNVEKHLQACLDSIFQCGMKEDEYELLAIDDCSPDSSLTILQSNASTHSSIRIVTHNVNKGLGAARNTGIQEAKGEYIWFVDSDDMICGSSVTESLDVAYSQRLDVLGFNYRKINGQGQVISNHLVFPNKDVYNGYDFVKALWGNSFVYHLGYVWRFIYRTDYLKEHNLFFPERVYWEDTAFMPKSILEADRIAATNRVMYSYRVNPESISGAFTQSYPAKHIFDLAFCAGCDLLHYTDEMQDDMLRQTLRTYAINKYINGFVLHLCRTNRDERYMFFQIVKEHEDQVRSVKEFMSPLARMIAFPFYGRFIAECLSTIYKMRHR